MIISANDNHKFTPVETRPAEFTEVDNGDLDFLGLEQPESERDYQEFLEATRKLEATLAEANNRPFIPSNFNLWNRKAIDTRLRQILTKTTDKPTQRALELLIALASRINVKTGESKGLTLPEVGELIGRGKTATCERVKAAKALGVLVSHCERTSKKGEFKAKANVYRINFNAVNNLGKSLETPAGKTSKKPNDKRVFNNKLLNKDLNQVQSVNNSPEAQLARMFNQQQRAERKRLEAIRKYWKPSKPLTRAERALKRLDSLIDPTLAKAKTKAKAKAAAKAKAHADYMANPNSPHNQLPPHLQHLQQSDKQNKRVH